jgi:16S rRNA (uracil1498-N3)-methyltransferase
MTRRRFYAAPGSFAPDGASVALSIEESRHLRDVLRLRAGDEAFVFDGEGREFSCVVQPAATSGRGGAGGAVTLEVRQSVEALRPESPLRLTLCVALLKGEKFDLVVQKATELGAWRIMPIVTARADVRLRDEGDTRRRIERWQRLALEAAKQSGRARLPEIAAPVSFASLVAGESTGAELRLMFAERAGVGLNQITCRQAETLSQVTALVGPEGGWEDEELKRAGDEGWTLITLGGRTLRAETAAITVAALLQHLFGDLR